MDLYRHECLLRWADVDSLGHINNVAYVDYLQEAHDALFRERREAALHDAGSSACQVEPLRYEVGYLAPLMLAARSVQIESQLSESSAEQFTITSEVVQAELGIRQVVARCTSGFGARVPRASRARGENPHALPHGASDAAASKGKAVDMHHVSLQTRRSDLNGGGHVSDVGCFEYLQEARIHLIAEMGIDPTATVVAQKNVDFFQARAVSPPYVDVWSWVSRVGSRSTTIESTIVCGDDQIAHGSVTLVFFSPVLQQSVSPSRDTLEALRSRVPN